MDVLLRSDTTHMRPEPPENDAESSVVVELALSRHERALLEEALRLTGLERPTDVLRIALNELVERQRFLSWVAAHERTDRSGNA
jgi:hypothetical protein